MKLTGFLQMQLSNINALYQDIVGDLTETEWVARISPFLNMPGFTAWHIARTQDNFVQTWIRGMPEVVHGERWAHWQRFRPAGIGAGVTPQEADEIAHSVSRADVLDYAKMVHQEMLSWLGDIDEAALDIIPETIQHLSHFPEYQTAGFHKDTDGLLRQPGWGILMKPCIGHVHRHLGELETIKTLLRKK